MDSHKIETDRTRVQGSPCKLWYRGGTARGTRPKTWAIIYLWIMVPWQTQISSTTIQAETAPNPVIHQCWAKLYVQEHKDLRGQAPRQVRTRGLGQPAGSENLKFPMGQSSSTAELLKHHGAMFGSSHTTALLPPLSPPARGDLKNPTRHNLPTPLLGLQLYFPVLSCERGCLWALAQKRRRRINSF